MAVEFIVVTSEDQVVPPIEPDGDIPVPTRGDDGSDIDVTALPVKLDELIRSIADTIGGSITSASDLTVEITGGITLTGKAGVKWVFFNVGAEAKTTNTLKVVLKTKIQPVGR